MSSVIYSIVGNYEDENNEIKFKGSMSEIIEELKEDKSYHMKVFMEVDYYLYLDIDSSDSKISFVIEDIMHYLEDLYEVDIDNKDFVFSENPKKKNTYRIIIPKYYTTIDNQLEIFTRFAKYNDKLGVDLSVYRHNQRIRLPEQTKPKNSNKSNQILAKHTIRVGKMEDFIMNIISKESKEFNCKFDKKNLNLFYDPNKNMVDTKDIKTSKCTKFEDNDVRVKETVDVNKLLGELSDDRFVEYDDWISTGMIIHSLSSELDGFEIWRTHSERGGDKFVENEWKTNGLIYKQHWLKFTNTINDKKKSINIIRKWIREDKPLQFDKPKQCKHASKYDFKQEFSTATISTFFVKHYGSKFIYKNKKLYYFNKVYWKVDEEMIYLNNIVKNEFYVDLIKEFQSYELEIMKTVSNDNSKAVMPELAKYKKQLVQLRGQKQREQFIKEICNDLNKDITFDTMPNLYAFNNKVYDLYQNKFVKAESDQYISMTTGYDYDDKYDVKKVEELQRLIDEIFTDESVKKLNLTILSTCLYGQNIEKFVINSGSGGNGKGVLNELVLKMSGNYGYKLPSNVLLQPIKQGCNPEIASMHNKRVIVSVEPDENEKIKTSTIKEITGGDEINARMAFSNETKTILLCTFIMECNEKPKLDSTGEAMYRRLIEISFTSKYVDKCKHNLLDEDQKQKVFIANSFYKSNKFKEDYKQALFMIIKEYFTEFKTNGLVIPQSIQSLTNDYMAVSDDVYEWINDVFTKTNDKKDIIKLKDVYEVFKGSAYFFNLSKLDKRKYNYKYFANKMETNFFMKTYIAEDKRNVKIMKQFKFSDETL